MKYERHMPTFEVKNEWRKNSRGGDDWSLSYWQIRQQTGITMQRLSCQEVEKDESVDYLLRGNHSKLSVKGLFMMSRTLHICIKLFEFNNFNKDKWCWVPILFRCWRDEMPPLRDWALVLPPKPNNILGVNQELLILIIFHQFYTYSSKSNNKCKIEFDGK